MANNTCVLKKAVCSLFVLYVIISVTRSLPSNSESAAAAQSDFPLLEGQEQVETMINQAQTECGNDTFSCSNNGCIPQSQRCDLVRNCYNDEFNCLTHRNGNVIYSKNGIDFPVCVNNFIQPDAVIKLCQLLGKGLGKIGTCEKQGRGIVFVQNRSAVDERLINFTPGNVQNCFLMNLTCSNKDCGKSAKQLDRLIVEGAVGDQFPWQVVVIVNHIKHCVGTLINKYLVLVATHCITGAKSASVYFGSVKGPYTKHHFGRSVRVMWFSDISTSISFLVLKKPIQMNDFVQPACLPSKSWVPNTECFITGWNKGDHKNGPNMKTSKVELLTKEACEKEYPFDSDLLLCAKANSGKPSGYDKSDGPLVCRNDFGYFEVVGVLSGHYNHSETNSKPSLFVSLYDLVMLRRKKNENGKK